MSDGNVIDIRSKSPIFNPPLREKLEEAMVPYLKDETTKGLAINTAEQVICTALVGVARSFATKIATRIFDKIGVEK